MATWSKDWDDLDWPHKVEIKRYLNDRSATAISDLELRAVLWLQAHGKVEGRDFHWQVKMGRYTVDLVIPGNHETQQAHVIELYGCGYHQCPTCFPEPWWPDVLATDALRQEYLEKQGNRFTAIWNHEDVEARLAEVFA